MEVKTSTEKKEKGINGALYYWKRIGKEISPVWFSCVMGTGILALSMKLSPVELSMSHTLGIVSLLDLLASVLWMSSVLLFILLILLWAVQWIYHPQQLQSSLNNFMQAQTWGAPPMACFTLASGFVIIGPELFGFSLCLFFAQALWLIGIIASLFSAVFIPYLMFTRHTLTTDATYGNWLLPVAPLIGAAVPAALLIPHLPTSLRTEILVLSYILWGSGIVLAAMITILFYARLAYFKVPQGEMVPTLWLILGPPGQSITAIFALGEAASVHWETVGKTLHIAGLMFSLPIWGFGMYWFILALLMTLRASRTHLPFSLGWWAFIYPLGVLTTGTYALRMHTQLYLFEICGMLLLCLLTVLWILVTTRTLRCLYPLFKSS
ncbi:MAG: hypothetical protein J2P36_08525 [Ktedonobacteraceae bacterium]|nr:hypothetical protein [Ktedonobacteraceae bacterium]